MILFITLFLYFGLILRPRRILLANRLTLLEKKLFLNFFLGILGLLSGILGACFFRNCYHIFGELMDILALINGAINFILYCFMSRQFRMTFEQLFKPRVLSKWVPKASQTDIQSTYVWCISHFERSVHRDAQSFGNNSYKRDKAVKRDSKKFCDDKNNEVTFLWFVFLLTGEIVQKKLFFWFVMHCLLE